MKILAPFAPHIAEEIWESLGNKSSIHLEKWPEYDVKLAKDDTYVIAVQVNGKVRAEIEIGDGASEEDVKEMVFSDLQIKNGLASMRLRKVFI